MSLSPVPLPAPRSADRSYNNIRPSIVRDTANQFADAKISNHKLSLFTSDVLMEGELGKKGEGGLQTWKNRMFILRGQELSYYTTEGTERCGALKGVMNIKGAVLERLEGNMFSITLLNSPSARVLSAPTVQALMDWMTAIAIAASATTMEPVNSLVDHSRTTHIILIRHGQYVSSNPPSQDMQGPLTPLGQEQARLTGRFLKAYLSARMVFKRFPLFPIYHSGTQRTLQTAQYITQAFPSHGFELREYKLCREAWPGNPLPSTNRKMLAREKLENMVSDCARVKIVYKTLFRHLIPDDVTLGERGLSESDQQQFYQLFGHGKSTQSRIGDRYRIVICHANIIRWFVCKALGVDPDGTWGRMRYTHCGITAMEVDSVGNVQLAYMNQTGHLETTMLTEN